VIRRRITADPEAGFTLTEVLAAMVVLGLAITAILAAMGSSIVASDIHRKLVTDDAVVRSYAERLAVAPYVQNASNATAAYTPAGVNLNLANWPGYSASLVKVECWTGASPVVFTDSCSSDLGLQRITLEAHSATNKGGQQQLQILKRQQ
jgi:prepilin-type N-terminal cleavage/methylation domain-containing protein